MNNFFKKIQSVQKSLSEKYGEFHLFCIVELEDNPGQWDVVASSDGLPSLRKQAIRVIIDCIYELFDRNDLMQLARVVVLDTSESFISEVLDSNKSQLSNVVINGLRVKKLFIVSSQNQKCHEQKLLNLVKQYDFTYAQLKN